MMDIEKLIEQLKYYGTTYAIGDNLGKEIDGSDELMLNAATALSTLKDENESLKEKLYDGEGVNLVDYWMQQAKIEENGHRNCQAENEKLREELESLKKGHCAGCSVQVVETEALRDLNDAPKLRAELEQVKQELDTAVECVNTVYSYILIKSKTEAVRTIEKWLCGQKEG